MAPKLKTEQLLPCKASVLCDPVPSVTPIFGQLRTVHMVCPVRLPCLLLRFRHFTGMPAWIRLCDWFVPVFS